MNREVSRDLAQRTPAGALTALVDLWTMLVRVDHEGDTAWTHAICAACWNAHRPAHPAVDQGTGDVELCCFCGKLTTSGLYVRHEPSQLSCAAPGRDTLREIRVRWAELAAEASRIIQQAREAAR